MLAVRAGESGVVVWNGHQTAPVEGRKAGPVLVTARLCLRDACFAPAYFAGQWDTQLLR